MQIVKSSQLRPLLCGFVTDTIFINKFYKYIFVFVSFYWGTFFWVSIPDNRYEIHSGYGPTSFFKKSVMIWNLLNECWLLVHCVKKVQMRSFFWYVFGHFSHSGGFQDSLRVSLEAKLFFFFFALGCFYNVIKSIESVYQ